jgi:hypothetical protein
MDQGSAVKKLGLFLFSLRRMATTANFHDLVEMEFGHEYTQWSRAFKWFVHHTRQTFGDKLYNNFNFCLPRFPEFASIIANYVNTKGSCDFAPGPFIIMRFVDNNNTGTCRPGSGPAGHGGPNAPRNE